MRGGIVRFGLLIVSTALAGFGVWLVPDRATGSTIGFAIFGVILGYNLWRRRPGSSTRRVIITYGIPSAITALMLLASTGDMRPGLAMTFAAATLAGGSIGSVVEGLSGGPRPAVIREKWKGKTWVEATTGDVSVRFDIRPLIARVTRRDARQAKQRFPAHPRAAASAVQKGLFLVAWPIIALLIPIAFTDEDYVTGPDAPAQITGMAAFFSLLIVGYVILGVLGVRGWRQKTRVGDHLRLEAFAAANSLWYHPGPARHTDGSELTRILSGQSGWLIANAAKPQQQPAESVAPMTQYYGLVEYRFPVQLPHLFLSRKGLRPPAFSSFMQPAGGQRLSLEGDFNRYFDTYCPRGYERDALYLLTPDVMAAFIDGARDFDIEIIGNRLILRSRSDVVTTDPAVWQAIASAVSALAGRTLQWRKWRDEHAGPDIADAKLAREAAKRGRLRGVPSIGAILIGAYALVYVGLVVLANTLGAS